jgi:hypothetical protein
MERGICFSCKTPVTLVQIGVVRRWVHDGDSGGCLRLAPTLVTKV